VVCMFNWLKPWCAVVASTMPRPSVDSLLRVFVEPASDACACLPSACSATLWHVRLGGSVRVAAAPHQGVGATAWWHLRWRSATLQPAPPVGMAPTAQLTWRGRKSGRRRCSCQWLWRGRCGCWRMCPCWTARAEGAGAGSVNRQDLDGMLLRAACRAPEQLPLHAGIFTQAHRLWLMTAGSQ
jgi:hypothetical protein